LTDVSSVPYFFPLFRPLLPGAWLIMKSVSREMLLVMPEGHAAHRNPENICFLPVDSGLRLILCLDDPHIAAHVNHK
jgi:hypothetical protein